MLNLNDISFPTNKIDDEKTNNSFSNVGLKSLLQNSELLEILMKPITEEKKEISAMPEIVNHEQDLSSLNFNDLLKPIDSIQCDHDYYNKDKINEVICSDPSKEYGNPFLGQNLWNENEIYQGDTFENLELEEFLNEKNLSDTDIYFLDSLQNSDIINDNSDQKASLTNKDIIEEESMKSFPIDPINISPEIPKKKFFDESLKLHPTLKKSKKQFVPNELKDEKYWSRRKKNNVAAKRSRDTRRLKENRIVIAASYLEKENEMLRNQLEEHKNEMLKLKTRLSHYESLKL